MPCDPAGEGLFSGRRHTDYNRTVNYSNLRLVVRTVAPASGRKRPTHGQSGECAGVPPRSLALWPLLVAAVSLFAVAGCGSGPESGGQPAPSPAPTVAIPTVTPTPAPAPTPTAVAVVPPEPSPTVAAEGPETGRTRHPAPDFTLPSAKGGSVALAALLEDSRGAVIVFYRGFF